MRDNKSGNGRVATVFLIVAAAAAGCSKEAASQANAEPAPAPSPAAIAPAPTPPPPPEPSPLEVLLSKRTLAEAIDHVRPQMTDTDDETSPGAILLAAWAMKNLTWSELEVTKNETSLKLIRKDSDAARGKRMCVRGQVIQIQKEKVGDDALFSGLLIAGNYSDIYSFIAVKSTGELVGNSRARFCGVAIGTYDYSNSGGGRGHAVSLVGMFDLPENRAN